MSGPTTPAGWYPDPNSPGQQRYWDGAAWTDNTAPGAGTAPAAPPAPPVGGYGAPGGYAPTSQVGYGYTQGPSALLAGFWSRFGAYLVDLILVGIVVSIIAAVLGIDSFVDTTDSTGATRSFRVSGSYQLLNLLVAAPYFLYLEGTSGQTLGKKLLGIQVVAADTLQPGIGYGKAAIRYLGRILSAIACLLGYLWMLWDGEKQTWHDKMASTKVVKTS